MPKPSCVSCWHCHGREDQEPCKSCGPGFTHYKAHSIGKGEAAERRKVKQGSIDAGSSKW